MEYMEGIKLSDTKGLDAASINRRSVLWKIHALFQCMVFDYGFLHCDPHPGNLLIRTKKKESPTASNLLAKFWAWLTHSSIPEWQLIVLDHGLYKTIPLNLRVKYASLWISIVRGQEALIKENFLSILRLANDEISKESYQYLYRLFSCILMQRAWTSIEQGLISQQRLSLFFNYNDKYEDAKKEELQVIRNKAPEYFRDTLVLLAILPKDFLLLLKTNDLLKHLDRLLLGPTGYFEIRSTLILLKAANTFLYQHQRAEASWWLWLILYFIKQM